MSDLPRRAALGAALGATPVAAAPDPARPRGPLVWRDMDQAALDAAYDQAVYAPNRDQVLRRYAVVSAQAREVLGPPQRVAYGAAEIEALDIHRSPRGGPAPVLVFIHGGAWRAGLARDYAFPAEAICGAGAHLVVPDFAWVQDRGGDLLPIADQIHRAIAWVVDHAASFGGDPARVVLAGHSSGAHMAAVALTTLPPRAIQGAVLVSGIYDLQAPRLSARSRYVAFTDAMEAALSPQRHLDRIAAPVTLVHGSLETPEFQRQSRDFAAALAAAGKPVRLLHGEGWNHFEIAETLANPYLLAGRAAIEMMGLRPG